MTSTRSRPERGRFLTLEGPEGAGKTTQAERLRAELVRRGVPVVLLREPGGTGLGEAIRAILLARQDAPDGRGPISPRADALLFNAARAQLVLERIEPALAGGTTVICSRFADSTLAYQGAGMGLPEDALRAIERFATGGLAPDLTILLDLPAEMGLGRKRGDEETRFESEYDATFHRRVRNGFLGLATSEPERFAIVDATQAPDSVFAALLAAVEARLGIPPAGATAVAAGRGSTGPAAVRSEPNRPAMRITR